MDPGRSLRKIPTRLRGMNFCTSSACFASSFVRQANGPECTQIVQNTPKRHFRVQWGGSGAFIAKKFGRDVMVRTFALVSARFAPSFVRQPKGPECTKRVRNAPKRQFRVQWGGRECSLRKIPMRLRGTNFCNSSARIALSFVRRPNSPECTQMVRNAPKRQFRD